MSGKFITNQKRFLSDVVNNILPSAEKLYFLVGYFYFSGFREIYENIGNKEVKILVGLDVEKKLGEKIKEFQIVNEQNISRKQIRENFNKSLIQIFNNTNYFDTAEKQEAFRVFLKKIKNGTLEIKKTSQSNHAKLYIFENKKEFSENGEYPGSIITGSSNLTFSGLRGRHEINVIFKDANSYKQAKEEIFDPLWDDAIDIVVAQNKDKFLNDVISNIWIDNYPKPFLLYIKTIDEFLSLQKSGKIKLPAELTKKAKQTFLDLEYQVDAIYQAVDIIEKHDGVIVADVVGLGKSIIASTVAHHLGLKTIIIAPPHLKDAWNDYRYDFKFNAKIYGSGSIEKALNDHDDSEEKLIIVDEAHRYRNEKKRGYADLHTLCQGNKVMLLTATPFNNRPQDIFSMIKLFQIPAKSTIQTIESLSYSFRELIKEYKDIQKSQKQKKESEAIIKKRIRALAKKIRDVLFPVVIRRSRLDLEAIDDYKKDLKAQNIEFSTVKPPKELPYDLGDLANLYVWTLEKIAPSEEEKGFIGARYKPVNYLKNFEKYRQKIEQEFGDTDLFEQSQKNLAKFMKRLLVSRFESSVMAFSKTLDSMIASSEYIKGWYEKLGKVPIYKKGNLPDIEILLEAAGEEIEQGINELTLDKYLEKYKEKGLQTISRHELKKSFIEDINKDIELLKEIKARWFAINFPKDPKLTVLAEKIKKWLQENPNRKIIVFSGYADTVNYLYNALKDNLRVFKYTSKDATSTNKQIIMDNFDAGIPENKQKNDFDVLFATDAISEGYNLHRAGIVVNYDIPYNPTRVIQRVGRINRIRKKVFDNLYIYNCFPTATGEEEIRTKQISTFKLSMIHALLGEDTKVLTSDEELESFFEERYKEARRSEDELSWDVNYRNLLNKIKNSEPEILEKARNLPPKIRIRRTVHKDKKGVLVFAKKGSQYVFKLGNANGIHSLNPFDALKLFEAKVSEKSRKESEKFEDVYQNIKRFLFSKKTEVPYDAGRAEAINKVDWLIENVPSTKDYLGDLKFVTKNLDSLPDHFAKKIRAISDKNTIIQLNDLKKIITHKYLITLREKANRIEQGEESLILSEELI